MFTSKSLEVVLVNRSDQFQEHWCVQHTCPSTHMHTCMHTHMHTHMQNGCKIDINDYTWVWLASLRAHISDQSEASLGSLCRQLSVPQMEGSFCHELFMDVGVVSFWLGRRGMFSCWGTAHTLGPQVDTPSVRTQLVTSSSRSILICVYVCVSTCVVCDCVNTCVYVCGVWLCEYMCVCVRCVISSNEATMLSHTQPKTMSGRSNGKWQTMPTHTYKHSATDTHETHMHTRHAQIQYAQRDYR